MVTATSPTLASRGAGGSSRGPGDVDGCKADSAFVRTVILLDTPPIRTTRTVVLSHPTRRNLPILMLCQCVATGGTVLVVTVGGIVGVALSPDPALGTLPMSLMVVGTACSAIPAAMLMQRFGRRLGYCAASLGAAVAALLGAWAVREQSFVWFCVCTLLIGVNVAFSQQYRFAAAESVAPGRAGRAVSLVLVGAVGGALLGPAVVTGTADVLPAQPFAGPFLVLAGLYALAAVLLAAVAEPQPVSAIGQPQARRPLREFGTQPLFLVAVLAGVVGQGVMTFIMTATPISMHVVDGFSLTDTAAVIRTHVLAMYLPSLASAALIGWLGVTRLMWLGLAAFVATVAIALQGHAYLHYWTSLLLLGVGWNFLFVGGTTLLVQSYRPAERFTAQAVNDFSVFGVAALGSLLAGSVVHLVGWQGVLWGSLPLLALMVGALVMLSQRPTAAQAGA
jgi:MFS family permease